MKRKEIAIKCLKATIIGLVLILMYAHFSACRLFVQLCRHDRNERRILLCPLSEIIR